jgi:ribonuclease P protein component
MKSYSFPRPGRLRSKKLIDELFQNGKMLTISPLKIWWLYSEFPMSSPAQALFVVSKKNFPHAVDRNYTRRRLREAYRLQKAALFSKLSERKKHLLIAMQYSSTVKSDSQKIRRAMQQVLHKLAEHVE